MGVKRTGWKTILREQLIERIAEHTLKGIRLVSVYIIGYSSIVL